MMNRRERHEALKLAVAEWNEEDHPRGDDGKFGGGGGGKGKSYKELAETYRNSHSSEERKKVGEEIDRRFASTKVPSPVVRYADAGKPGHSLPVIHMSHNGEVVHTHIINPKFSNKVNEDRARRQYESKLKAEAIDKEDAKSLRSERDKKLTDKEFKQAEKEGRVFEPEEEKARNGIESSSKGTAEERAQRLYNEKALANKHQLFKEAIKKYPKANEGGNHTEKAIDYIMDSINPEGKLPLAVHMHLEEHVRAGLT